jgi:hypothetical protein
MGLKRLGQAAWGVQRAVHGVEQRQIAQLETAVKEALRKYITVILDFIHKWLQGRSPLSKATLKNI